MSGLRRLRVTELHPNLLCILCGGYYVDATTIVECLHSFCKTCIVRYLESSKFCPICDVQVHKTKPLLSIRPDKTLQDIVYKLVPGLYQNEMCKRRDFYSCHPETPPATPEDGGSDIGRWYILPDDPVSLALHPASPSSSSMCFNSRLMPAASINSCLNTSLQTTRDQITHQLSKNLGEGHVRYLQCPAGVSVAQLKRLLRAKFGVGPSHPMALITTSSDDPLHDTLTLVDVAYITSWQRTEPLQLFYRIYERASKKIKLDPDTFNSEAVNSSEEMPKLEPSVGGEVTNAMYGSSDSTNSLSDYSSAPLLQAVGALGFDSLGKKESPVKASVIETSKSETAVIERPFEALGYNASGEKNDITGKPTETVKGIIDSCAKDSQVMEKCDSLSELTQGTVGDSDMNMESSVSGSSVVDTIVTYSGAYTTPSNGVSVGVAFVPGELGYISPAGVPCAIIPSGGCVPVTGNCISSNANIPVMCNTDVHRPVEGDGETGVVNKWNTTGPVKEGQILRESTQVPAGVNMKREGERGSEEDEGKEVQLKISESGVMSVCGRDTTVEGVLNSIESEACELLSKIESGSLCDDFAPKAVEGLSEKNTLEVSSETKKSKAKDKLSDVVQNKGDAKGSKEQLFQKGEKTKSSDLKPVSLQNQKSESSITKEIKGARPNVNSSTDCSDIVCNDKTVTESVDKMLDRKADMKKQGELQNGKELRDGNTKDSRSSHIPASLTAASMANLNKPHLKAGTCKTPPMEENKNKEQKSNNGFNSKKEGKQESIAKSSSSSGCRKSSQSYGYKTLKTPPKSWNPTISREQLALVAGKSIGKGNKEPPRTNKFFKARNAPRFLGNPSAGVKPMYSGSVDSNGSQKCNVVLKLDPKTLGPVTVPVNNDVIPPVCSTSSVSSSTSSVSSVQSATPGMTQTALSTLGSLSLQPVDQKTPSGVQTGTSTAETHAAVSRVEDTVVTSTKAALTMPTSLSSGIKESTNNSSKVIGNTNTLQDSKNTLHNKSIKIGRSSSNNNNSTTNRNVKLPSVQTRGTSSKHEISGVSVPKSENKTNGGTVGLVGNTMTSLVASNPLMNQLKLAASTAMTTGITQVKAETVNSLTAVNTGLQPQQHLTLGSPTVGVSIIPSCGVSFPGAIGTLPLPYYTNPSLGYPAYPYLYQGAETIGLIPPPPSASFIPTFPACLPPRSSLSPRNIGGAKMMPELPLQSSLLPMVPLVSQVPAQAMSPRPMTPPSPRTPTSSQSPRPYPAQSPRQSNTNQSSRPLTPQSPKPVTSGQSSRSQTQSPKSLSILQPTVTQSHRLNNTGMLVTQPHCIALAGQSEKFQSGSQQMSPLIPSIPESSVASASTSLYPQNSSCKQNVCVQTSVSHTSITPKSFCNTLNSLKPPVPQSPRAVVSNQPGVCLMQALTTTSSQSSTSHTPQSPKLNSPQTPQSPRSLSSTQCTVMQTHVNSRLSQPNSPQSRHQGMSPLHFEGRISNSSKNKTKTVEEANNRKIENVTHGQLGETSSTTPNTLVSSSLLPVSQVTSPLLMGGLNNPITSGSGNKMHLSHGTHVSLPSNISSLCPNSILNSLPVPLANTIVSPEVSSTAMSFSMCSSSAPLPLSLNNVSSSVPLVTYNSTASSVPACPATVPQAFYPGSTTLSTNLPSNTVPIASHPLSTTQTSQSTSTVCVTAGHTPKSSASIMSISSTSSTGVGSAPCRNTAVVTLPTENTAFAPIPFSSSSGSITIPTSSVAAVTQTSCTTAAVTMPVNTTTVVTKSPAVTSAKYAPPHCTPCISLPLITAVTPLVSTPYVPLSSTVSIPVPINDTASTPVPTSSITSTPLPLGSIVCTSVPLSSTAHTTVTQSSTESKTIPLSTSVSVAESPVNTPNVAVSPSSTSSTIVPKSNTMSITVPQSSMVSTTVPISSVANTTVSMTCTDVAAAPIKSTASTGVPVSNSPGRILPVNSTEIATVSSSSKPSTTVPVSCKPSTTIALGSTAGTSIPVISTAGISVPPSSTVGTSISVSSTAGISIPLSSSAVVARSQSSGCFAPCGTAGGNLVLSAKERGGSEPQSSACTPVCDVTHVIDAKQQCAEPSVSSSGGPRPCLKS